jgi:hypothetical protein
MSKNWSDFIRWMASRSEGGGKNRIAKNLWRVALHVANRREAMIACMSNITLNSEEFDLYVRQWQAADAPASSDPPPVHGATAHTAKKQWEYTDTRGAELEKLGKAGWKSYAVDDGRFYLRRRVTPESDVKYTLKSSIAPEQPAPTDVPPTHGLVSDGEAKLRERFAALAQELDREKSERDYSAASNPSSPGVHTLRREAHWLDVASRHIRAILSDHPPVHG